MNTPNNFQRGYRGIGEWVYSPIMMAGSQPMFSTAYPFPMPIYLNNTHYPYINNYQLTPNANLISPNLSNQPKISN